MTVQVREILVPLDFSEHADAVLEWAIHLAGEHGSGLTLLHAYHPPVEFQQLEGAYLPADFWVAVKTEAEESLRRYAERARAAGLRCEVLVREGYPATVVEDAAAEINADLIVIGTRGHTGLKHLLLGSIAERVVQKAPCAVLAVKPTRTEED